MFYDRIKCLKINKSLYRRLCIGYSLYKCPYTMVLTHSRYKCTLYSDASPSPPLSSISCSYPCIILLPVILVHCTLVILELSNIYLLTNAFLLLLSFPSLPLSLSLSHPAVIMLCTLCILQLSNLSPLTYAPQVKDNFLVRLKETDRRKY